MTDWITGWKAIAAYLNVSIRTAQEYVKMGMPVFKILGSVMAKPDEIDKFIREKNISA